MRYATVVLAMLALAVFSAPAWTQEKAADKAAEKVQEKPKADKFVVAVLDFETGSKELEQYGQAVPDLLTTFLTNDDTLQLVERAQLKKIFEEMALGVSGIVDDATKAKIGQLTGAKFLITGRVFIVGKQLFITAKIMSTETGKVGAKTGKGSLDMKLDEIVQKLAESISAYMAENAAAMQPKVMTEQDVIDALKKKLEGKTLPKFAVVIPESYVGHAIPDPAAETEFNTLLRACGATVINTKDDATGDWAKSLFKEANKPIPQGLDEADIAIVGQGLAEYAGTTEKLISARARLEIKAVEIKSGKILATGRTTTTAVDLAEHIAAKSALQKAAADLALKIIPDAVDELAKLRAEPAKP